MTTPPQQPPQPQPGPPVQKSKAGPIIAIIGVVLLVICLGCAGGSYYLWFRTKKAVEDVVNNLPSNFPTNGAANPQNNGNTTHTVRYEVNGSGQAQIIYTGATGQDTLHADLPWSKDFTITDNSYGLQVFAIPDDGNSGLQNCRILVDGSEKKKVDYTSGTLQCSYISVG